MPAHSWVNRRAAVMTLVGAAVACSAPRTAKVPAGQWAVGEFSAIAEVLQHPRCMNCHPGTERPRWGELGALEDHRFNVTAGTGAGLPGLPCSTCHGDRNFAAGGVPGSPHWALAPASMGWVGLTAGQLCRAVLDRRSNGDRSMQQVVSHMLGDGLVAWAFEPGTRPSGVPRQKPPLSREAFSSAVRRWAQAGAPCPGPEQ